MIWEDRNHRASRDRVTGESRSNAEDVAKLRGERGEKLLTAKIAKKTREVCKEGLPTSSKDGTLTSEDKEGH